MLKSKTLLSATVSALGLVLAALAATTDAAKAEETEYRFVVPSSTPSGVAGTLAVPVRAPFVGLRAALRICFDRPTAAVASVQLNGPETPVGLTFEVGSEHCVVTQEVDFSRTLSATGETLAVEVRLFDGVAATFLVPVAGASPYLSSEFVGQVSAPKLGTMTGTFPANPITSRTKNLIVCATGSQSLTEAKLWMPAHGHGSTATVLTARADGCYLVDRLNFVMTGVWEVRTKWGDGSAAVLSFNVIGAL